MANCPVCKTEIKGDMTDCPVCGRDLSESHKSGGEWVILGRFDDKMSAELAIETLKSLEIPAVMFSRSGIFGEMGLPLTPFYGGSSAAYEISVPEDQLEEATNVLESVLGNNWHQGED